MTPDTVGQFFDALTPDYTAAIERCFPRYREMLWALLDYLPQEPKIERILELGCGTGNLTVLLTEKFPESSLVCVDLSAESLEVCRDRLGARPQLDIVHGDFRNLPYVAGEFDLIISSIAVHHLEPAKKRDLFRNCFHWLTADGIFTFADQFRGANDDLYARHMQNWKQLSLSAGSTENEFEMWMQHQREHDHHDTLADQINWITGAGFSTTDCTWRYLLWSVLQARKG
jgi:tRNA (cmo5U34)-methyltransferase